MDSSVADTGATPEAGGDTGSGEASADTGVDAPPEAAVEAGTDAPPDAPACTTGVVAACGRGGTGVYCAATSGNAFAAETLWQPAATAFSDAAGWKTTTAYYENIQFPDVNGDGLADLCARSAPGVTCALGNGVSFGAASAWQPAGPGCFSDSNGFAGAPSYYATVQFPDVNGDGKADACARGGDAVYCAVSSGSAFAVGTQWQTTFSDANGWNTAPYYTTIQFPDVNGDGKADVCGRGPSGIVCALSNGTTFGAIGTWQAAFSDANLWNSSPAYYETIAFPDVNGDGKADVCGRGNAGINCALSDGTQFGTVSVWNTYFADTNAWKSTAAYYLTIQFPDVNGDGKADVCGRGAAGLECAISTGTQFGTAVAWQAPSSAFSDANGWNSAPQYYEAIDFPDLNGDGMADTCGRGQLGLWCGVSDGTSFGTATLWQTQAGSAFSDGNGWNSSPSNWGTIGFPTASTGTCKPGNRPTPYLRPAQRFAL